jgi:hypothetical protein
MAAFSTNQTLDVPFAAPLAAHLQRLAAHDLPRKSRSDKGAAIAALKALAAVLKADALRALFMAKPRQQLTALSAVARVRDAPQHRAVLEGVLGAGVEAQNFGPLMRWLNACVGGLELAMRAGVERRRWALKHYTETGKVDLRRTGYEARLAIERYRVSTGDEGALSAGALAALAAHAPTFTTTSASGGILDLAAPDLPSSGTGVGPGKAPATTPAPCPTKLHTSSNVW